MHACQICKKYVLTEEELVEPEPITVVKYIEGVDAKDIAHNADIHKAEKAILERQKCVLVLHDR